MSYGLEDLLDNITECLNMLVRQPWRQTLGYIGNYNPTHTKHFIWLKDLSKNYLHQFCHPNVLILIYKPNKRKQHTGPVTLHFFLLSAVLFQEVAHGLRKDIKYFNRKYYTKINSIFYYHPFCTMHINIMHVVLCHL